MYRVSVLSGEIRVVLSYDLLLRAIDEKRMVTALAQFHHRVHQVGDVGRRHRAFVEEREVTFEYRTVEFLLDRRQLHLDRIRNIVYRWHLHWINKR